ncbi:MAG: endonuclease/exonuclease/phosphatase family protein, partial [Planctomycetota bacterium JB042]
MVARLVSLVLLVTAAFAPAALATERLRVVTFNVKDVGSNGSSQQNALKAVLSRIDADVCLLQEVDVVEAGLVPSFGASIGYPYFKNSGTSGTLSGGLMVAVLSRHPIVSSVSWSAAMASGDPTANDITRNLLQVTIDVPDACDPVVLFTFHLKASGGSTNEFRRAIELLRLKKVVETYVAAHPTHHVILGGDFNEDLGDAPFGQSFSSLPSGLPQTFKLGNDVQFPVTYDPFQTVQSIGGLGLAVVDATQEDSTGQYATFQSGGARLDYLFRRPLALPTLGDEVYSSFVDNGVDDAPTGQWLWKTGAPPPSNAVSTASDHYPVFADLLLESCAGVRYGFGSAGAHLLTARAGITGDGAVGDAAFGLKAVYTPPHASCLLVLGMFKLSPPFGLSLNPYVPGAFLHVSPVSLYGIFPVTADSAGRA